MGSSLRHWLDFTEPVAVLMMAVLHFVSDADDPQRVVAGYRAVLAPGSYLALSHVSADYDDPTLTAQMQAAASTRPGSTRGNPASSWWSCSRSRT